MIEWMNVSTLYPILSTQLFHPQLSPSQYSVTSLSPLTEGYPSSGLGGCKCEGDTASEAPAAEHHMLGFGCHARIQICNGTENWGL